MLTYQRCNSCGGVYAPVQADGTSYFHVCPPVPQFFDDTGAPITADAADGILKLGGTVYRRDVERPNQRDENVMPDPAKRGATKAKAEGAGAVAFTPAPDPLAGAIVIDGSVAVP